MSRTTFVVVAMDVLTDLQLAVMKSLWRVGEGTVLDVGADLSRYGRELAPTTVATLLQRLEKQGWVMHRREGRQFVYRAKIKEKTAARGALTRVVRSFFDGRVSDVAAQLFESEDLTSDDLRAIRNLLEKRGGTR
ncbi:MAG: BlaI/MecI/CopY family transcriptional regulator [Polyangiaceae bacterium]